MEAKLNPNLAEEIFQETGTEARACYQCLKCSGGCPVAVDYMDFPPSQIMRFIQLGMEDKALNCNTYWVCAACETCGVRCPNDIDIPHIMDNLKQRALKQGLKPPEKKLLVFHQAFLNSIRRYGRVFEPEMMGEHKMRTGDFFSDMGLGLGMFTRGKLGFFPSFVKGRKEVKNFYKTSKERKKQAEAKTDE